MGEYRVWKKRRIARQAVMAVVFLAVVIGGWRYPLLGYFIPLCMILGLWIGFRKGRKWCDWYCPRGSFNDTLLKAVSPKKEIPKFFKGLPFRIGFLSFLMLMMTVQIVRRWPDPYRIGMFFVILLTITTILGIILALIFHQRTWCCFCPIGSIANWTGKGKYQLKIDSELCTECKLCFKVCPIQVAPYQFKKSKTEPVTDGDCLKCKSCVVVCPGNALNF